MRRFVVMIRLGIVVFLISVTGCGTNILLDKKGAGYSNDTVEGIVESSWKKMEIAKDVDDFEEIQEDVQSVIDEEAVATETLKEAYVIKGQALLGAHQLSLLSLASSVFELEEDETEGGSVLTFSDSSLKALNGADGKFSNILEILGKLVEGAPADDLGLAADALNYAHELAEAYEFIKLPQNIQMIRGIANALFLVKYLTIYFVFDEHSGASYRSGYGDNDVVDIMDDLFDLNGDGDATDTDRLTAYGEQMYEAFQLANLPQLIEDELDRVYFLVDDFDGLYSKMQESDGVFEGRVVGTDAGSSRFINIRLGVSDRVKRRLGVD